MPMKDSLTTISQILRKNMTKEEKHLWYDYLKKLAITVKRQAVFDDKYIADFYIPEARLVIELDGSQHYTADGELKDRIRDDYFHIIGITVLRYSNLELHRNFCGVCGDIQYHIDAVIIKKRGQDTFAEMN